MDKTEGTEQRVGGYRVVRKLATGGTSEVLLAKAEGPHGFERSVVLKLLLPEYKHDAEFKGMFAREAAAYARLSHPSIVRLYDFFANEDQLVMVLEYIDGPPLSRLRAMFKAIGQQLDDTTALYVASSIFSALAAAHGAVNESGEPAPVIHRDVNPSNVLVPWDGTVKLADFGVAKVTGASHQSRVGLIRGTFGYMAPEQVKGETVTPRADVYAGAIILWELLTKRRAFIRGALPEIEVLRLLAEPRIVSIDAIRPDVDKRVRDAIKRALEPHGDKRTITAEEMASLLDSVVPEDQGREHLAKALAQVRHEPNPSATSIPPPVTMTFGGPDPAKYEPRAGMATKLGLAPKVTPPPRPAVAAPPRPAVKASEPPLVVQAEVATSSERGLAALLEPSESDPRPVLGPLPLISIAADPTERNMRDSIDDILRSMPSNVPPNLFPKTDPPGGIPVGPVGVEPVPLKDTDVLADPFARGLSHIPAPPPQLDPSLPLNLGATLVAPSHPSHPTHPTPLAGSSSFPPLDRTLAIARPPVRSPSPPAPMVMQGTSAPPPTFDAGASPSTSRMAGFSGPSSPPAPTAPPAFVPPPLGAAGSYPPATLPLGSAAPRAAHVSNVAPGSYPPAHVPSSGGTSSVPSVSGAYPLVAAPSAPPAAQNRRGPMLLVAALLVVVVAGGGAAAVYLRRPKPHVMPVNVSVPASAVAVAPSETATASAPPAASSSALSPPSPSAAPAPLASVAPSVSASPSASPSASAAASAADVPAGMGRVRTVGAAPGRRIFVDDRTVGQTPEAVVVKCGVRSIKLGSAGVARSIDVPCGAEITVGDR